MSAPRRILQIVPRAPGSREGVGDYAQLLADGLRERNCLTTFAAAEATTDDQILSPLQAISDEQWRQHEVSAIILHFVNYGYHPRGVPRDLPAKLERIREICGGRLVTIFHELYATGSWRQSAFWLRPIQRGIARAIACSSSACVVSSAVLAEQLHRLAPTARVMVRPVPSTFGEPLLSPEQITDRDPRRWTICGGSELIQRSLRSFLRCKKGAADLVVVGGADSAATRQLLRESGEIATRYLPNVEATVASAALSESAFGWIDYFERVDVPGAAILKSTAFAAYCAHGVVPVFPSRPSPIGLDNDTLPGPFSFENLPAESERPKIAQATYAWYHRNASAAHLAESVAALIP